MRFIISLAIAASTAQAWWGGQQDKFNGDMYSMGSNGGGSGSVGHGIDIPAFQLSKGRDSQARGAFGNNFSDSFSFGQGFGGGRERGNSGS